MTARLMLLLLMVFAVPAAPSRAQDRVALVIGNGAWAHAPKLPNPPNDAGDIAAALRDLDFEVIVAADVDKSAFDSKLREFARALRNARTALFFYAGHGMQVAGKNYAVPIDSRLENAADLQVETIDIDQVLAVMQASDNRVSLVFIDACRDKSPGAEFRPLPAGCAVGVGEQGPLSSGRGPRRLDRVRDRAEQDRARGKRAAQLAIHQRAPETYPHARSRHRIGDAPCDGGRGKRQQRRASSLDARFLDDRCRSGVPAERKHTCFAAAAAGGISFVRRDRLEPDQGHKGRPSASAIPPEISSQHSSAGSRSAAIRSRGAAR